MKEFLTLIIFILLIMIGFAFGIIYLESDYSGYKNEHTKILHDAGIDKFVRHTTVIDGKETTNWVEIVWLKK